MRYAFVCIKQNILTLEIQEVPSHKFQQILERELEVVSDNMRDIKEEVCLPQVNVSG